MNKKLISLTFMLVLSVFLVASVSASVESLFIATENNTEFNTGTPTISANVTGNCTGYYANLTINGVDVVTDVSVANNTNTDITATTSTSAGSYIYNVTFWNETCDSGISNTTDNNVLEINAQPSISAVTSTGGALLVGKTVTFTTTWTDENSTGTDNVTIYVCKTDAFTTSCTGGEWASSSGETDNSTAPTYTISTSDTGGTKNYYVYAMDDNNYATTSGTSGTFLVSRPIEGETFDTTTTTTGETGELPLGLIAVIAIILIVSFIVLRKK